MQDRNIVGPCCGELGKAPLHDMSERILEGLNLEERHLLASLLGRVKRNPLEISRGGGVTTVPHGKRGVNTTWAAREPSRQ